MKKTYNFLFEADANEEENDSNSEEILRILYDIREYLKIIAGKK